MNPEYQTGAAASLPTQARAPSTFDPDKEIRRLRRECVSWRQRFLQAQAEKAALLKLMGFLKAQGDARCSPTTPAGPERETAVA